MCSEGKMDYKTTYDQCRSMISGICSRCGGSLEPIETVDNAGDPTFWQGCKSCCVFCSGVTPEVYRVAKKMVESRYFRPYSHIEEDSKDTEDIKQHKLKSQIGGACDVVADVLRIHNPQMNRTQKAAPVI